MHAEERIEAAEDAMTIPEQEPDNKKTKYVFMTAKLADGFICSDQTGAYQRTPNKGNKCICVFFYIYDANRILGLPIKSRHSPELLKAYQQVYKWCKSRGFTPMLHKMDKKTSNEVEEFIKEQQTGLQYTAPRRHCAPAEKAVQT